MKKWESSISGISLRRLFHVSTVFILLASMLPVASGLAQDEVDPADAILSDDYDPADEVLSDESNEPSQEPDPEPENTEPDPQPEPEVQETEPENTEPEAAPPEPDQESVPEEAAVAEEPVVADEPAVLEVPAAAAVPTTESSEEPAESVDEPVVEEPIAAATPVSAQEDADTLDIADSILDEPPVAADVSTDETDSEDVADSVLAEEAESENTAETESGYEELRQTIEASVQIYELDDLANLHDGLLIRRGRAGAKASPSLQGFSGVFRAISGDMPPQKSFRFGTHFGFYRVPNGWDKTSQSHLDALGYFSYSVRDDLEIRIAAAAAGHHSGVIKSSGQDALFQTLGDLTMGGKYAYKLKPFLSLAGTGDLQFYTQVGSMLISPKATSFRLTAAGTLDLEKIKKLKKVLPIRLHANMGYFLNRSGHLLGEVQVKNASTLGGFGLATGDQLPFVVAGEYIYEPIIAFFEYSADPTVRQRVAGSVVRDRPSYLRSPHRMTLGVRWNAVENFLLDFALDYAHGLNKAVLLFDRPEPPGPPYELHFGFSYEWNPKTFEVVDLRGKISGLVLDAETGESLGGAVIEYLDTDKYTRQVADIDTGAFETYKLPPGEILMRVTVDGYEPAILNPDIPQRGVLDEKIFLRRPEVSRGPVGALVGEVIDEEGLPVSAVIRFLSAEIEPVRTSVAEGGFVKILPEGDYEVEVAASGYESKIYQVPVIAQKKTKVSFQLISGTMAGALVGQVLDANGRPVQATVLFLDAQIDPLQTDATGGFSKILPPGKYQIEVRARGYLARTYEAPIEKGRKTVLDIQVEEEQSVGAFAGKILAEDGSPIAGIITFFGVGVAPVPADPTSGEFAVLLEAGTYDVAVEAPDYESLEDISIPVLRGKKTVQDFRLKPRQALSMMLARIEGDKILTEQPISFESGSTLLTEDSYPILESIAKLFFTLPANKNIRIEAHTHNLGPSDANLRLSQDRTEQIKVYLSTLGVPEGRLEAIGRGEDKPIADNATLEGRHQNERIEISIR